MNWVGGSRSRLLSKDDAKKQREFFEKRKLQMRLMKFGLPLPNSEVTTADSRSMDLLSLFIVNRIAVKKEKKDPPKVAVLSRASKGAPKQRKNESLVLPMSPCSPSKLSLAGSEPVYNATRKRKHVSKLSPVIESAFSDNSASDYAPRAADTHSPISTLSASSGLGGQLLLRMNQEQSSELPPEPTPQCSQLLGSSEPEHTLVQNNSVHLCGSDVDQLETPLAAPVPIDSSTPLEADGRVNVNSVVHTAFSYSDIKTPVPDFSLNQSQKHFEEAVLWSVNKGEFTLVEGAMSKIHLKGNTPLEPSKPQAFPETQRCEVPSFTSTSSAGPENSITILGEGQYSSRCFSSDQTVDTEPCVDSCKTPSPLDHARAESIASSLGTLGQMRPLPPLKRRLKIRAEASACLDELNINDCQQSGSRSTPLYRQTLPHTQCKCWTECTETREIATQTDDANTTEKCDFAVQCSLMPEPEAKPPMIRLYRPPAETLVPSLSTRGQTVHTDEEMRDELKASPGMSVRNVQENLNHKVTLETFRLNGDGQFCENRAKQSGDVWCHESIPEWKANGDEVKDVKSGAKANAAPSENVQSSGNRRHLALLKAEKWHRISLKSVLHLKSSPSTLI